MLSSTPVRNPYFIPFFTLFESLYFHVSTCVRKRIGQETRKEKLMNKEVRRHQQARDNQTEDFKDSLLILLAVVGVFGAVYLILFFAVRKNPSEDV